MSSSKTTGIANRKVPHSQRDIVAFFIAIGAATENYLAVLVEAKLSCRGRMRIWLRAGVGHFQHRVDFRDSICLCGFDASSSFRPTAGVFGHALRENTIDRQVGIIRSIVRSA
jgi:hypothetical protein